MTPTVRHAGLEIICDALDLAKPDDHLLAQVRDLATRLARADSAGWPSPTAPV